MNIHKATKSYETWMRSCTAVIEAHLRLKHKRMRESPFLFFRAMFYDLGELRFLDLVNQQRVLIEAETTVINAQVELNAARADLENLIGGVSDR